VTISSAGASVVSSSEAGAFAAYRSGSKISFRRLRGRKIIYSAVHVTTKRRA
jgi:hypothetical protein